MLRAVFCILLAIPTFAWAAKPLPRSLGDSNFAVELPKGYRLALSRRAPTEELQSRFDALPDDLRVSFLLKRHKFIQLVARGLAGPRMMGAMVSGASAVTFDAVAPYLPSFDRAKAMFRPVVRFGRKIYTWLMAPVEQIVLPDPTIARELEKSDQLDFQFGEPEPISEILPEGTISARGVEVLRGIVNQLDLQLWSDARKLAETTHYNVTILVGPSAGVAGGNVGFFKMGGFEYEAGADFASGRFYDQIHPITQRLKRALALLESHFILGVLVKFVKRENGETAGDGRDEAIQFPPLFSYRSNNNMVGFGAYFGLNLLDMGCLYMIATGSLGKGGLLYAFFKLTSVFSTYATEYRMYQKFALSPAEVAQRFRNWFKTEKLTPQEQRAAQQVLDLVTDAEQEIEREETALGWDPCELPLRARLSVSGR